MTESENDSAWEKFCMEFDDGVELCSKDGTHKRMTIQFNLGKFPVVVDIYPKGGTMKKFDELVLGAVKQQTGIDLLKEEK